MIDINSEMNENLRRHISLSQSTIHWKKKPVDAAVTINDSRQMIHYNTWKI